MSDGGFVEFSLSPLSEIVAWGNEGAFFLSWFGFSLGRYRLRFGDEYLLNYSAAIVDRTSAVEPDVYPGPFVDYPVVRLWEDLIRLVPYVLPEVSRELAPLARLDEKKWPRWIADAFMEEELGTVDAELIEVVEGWRDEHRLDTGYLSPSARIAFWNIEGEIEVRWDNRAMHFDRIPAWSAELGHYRMSKETFLAGVQSFNNDFLRLMGDRVDEICRGSGRPEVRVDLEQLRREQADRTTWFAKELERTPGVDPSAVIAAVEALLAVVPLHP